jgi:hypothetical protein
VRRVALLAAAGAVAILGAVVLSPGRTQSPRSASTQAPAAAPTTGEADIQALVEIAESSPNAGSRRRAYESLKRLGAGDRVDQLTVIAAELRGARTCAERKAILPRVRELGDPRALPLLRRERDRRAGLAGLFQSVNRCMGAELEAAIREIEARQPSASAGGTRK